MWIKNCTLFFFYFSLRGPYVLTVLACLFVFPAQHTNTNIHTPTCFCIWTVLHFAFCLYLQHTTQISMPPARFFCNVLFIRLAPLYPLSSRHLCLYNTQHIYVPGGIQTRNPSRQAATDLRPRPHGHWDRPIQSTRKCLKLLNCP